jgi:hypothetical protein
MIEVLEGLPDNVVAFVAKGRETRRDYDQVLIPKVVEALGRHEKIRCYYELGSEFSGMDSGAIWEDVRVGFAHLSHWERVAVVTDVDWIRFAISMFRFLVPGEVRVFGADEASAARHWISET